MTTDDGYIKMFDNKLTKSSFDETYADIKLECGKLEKLILSNDNKYLFVSSEFGTIFFLNVKDKRDNESLNIKNKSDNIIDKNIE